MCAQQCMQLHVKLHQSCAGGAHSLRMVYCQKRIFSFVCELLFSSIVTTEQTFIDQRFPQSHSQCPKILLYTAT